jgi:CDP-diacylglycerol--glycerol-3-phosphate 3-phosphatidyltransferase
MNLLNKEPLMKSSVNMESPGRSCASEYQANSWPPRRFAADLQRNTVQQSIQPKRIAFMKREQPPILITIANGLTLGRLCAIPFVIYLLAHVATRASYSKIAIVVIIILQASDVLDGFFARRAQKTHRVNNVFGQIMDPAADKLYINSSCVTLSLMNDFPWWVTLTIFSKDLLITLAWLAMIFVTGNTLVKPDLWGKAADSFQACLIFTFLLNIPRQIFYILGSITVGLTIISGITLIIRDIQKKRYTSSPIE